MNEETNQILKEIRDLQKESIENQKKALEHVKTQQKGVVKKITILLIVFLVLTFILNIIK